jgi:squalene cyclase
MTQGWLGVHACVTGAAIQSLLVHGEPLGSKFVQSATSYLLQEREATGVWRSYWWKGYGYSTYHALRSLSMVRALDVQEARRTSRFLLLQQQEDGGWNDSLGRECEVFSTAFILLSLLLFPDEEILAAAEDGVSWLLHCQNSEGGWPTAPILRIPPPMVKEPQSLEIWRLNQEGTGVLIEDSAGVFTSAAALWALSVFKSLTE